MKTLRIPLVGSQTNRGSNAISNQATKDQIFINCFPEVGTNPVTGKSTAQLLKRCGYTSVLSLTGVGSPALGILVWTGNTSANAMPVASFVNNPSTTTSVWDITSTGSKLGGDIANTNMCYVLTETVISGTANLVGYFRDSGTSATEQWYYPEGGAWTQTTDSDFPSDVVGSPVHMDGYVLNMTASGKIHNSDLNSVSSYTAANYFSTNAYPDKGVTVVRLNQHVVAFGEASIEFLVNAGNATGSPLQRVGSIRMGAVRSTTGTPTVIPAFGNVYWIGSSPELAATGIYRFKGTEPEKISTPAVDKLISSGDVYGIAGAMMLNGMRHVAFHSSVNLPDSANGFTLCYCIDTGFWWALNTAGVGTGVSACCPWGLGVTTPNAKTIFLGSASELYGQFANAETQDGGSNFTMTVRTQNIDLGTRRKKIWTGVSVIGDVQTSTCNVAISYSDDDYATSSAARNIDMSSASENRLTRWGTSRRRSWKFTNSSATPLRIEAVEFEYEVGLS